MITQNKCCRQHSQCLKGNPPSSSFFLLASFTTKCLVKTHHSGDRLRVTVIYTRDPLGCEGVMGTHQTVCFLAFCLVLPSQSLHHALLHLSSPHIVWLDESGWCFLSPGRFNIIYTTRHRGCTRRGASHAPRMAKCKCLNNTKCLMSACLWALLPWRSKIISHHYSARYARHD